MLTTKEIKRINTLRNYLDMDMAADSMDWLGRHFKSKIHGYAQLAVIRIYNFFPLFIGESILPELRRIYKSEKVFSNQISFSIGSKYIITTVFGKTAQACDKNMIRITQINRDYFADKGILFSVTMGSIRQGFGDLPKEYVKTLNMSGTAMPITDNDTGLFDIDEVRKNGSYIKRKNAKSSIQDVKRYLLASYQNPDLSLTSVADFMNFEKTYFCTVFKKEVGVNFIDYLTDIRIQHAQVMLVNMDDTISNIALQVGYRNTTYFCTKFKEITGMSPSEYRSRNRNIK